MIVPMRYTGTSAVVRRLQNSGGRAGDTEVRLAANTLREAVYFRGQLASPLAFREAAGALHRVVSSDLKYRPREREAYRRWLAEQDRIFLASLSMRTEADRLHLEELEAAKAELDRRRERRYEPFYRSRLAYLRWAVHSQVELAWLLDPVITVHPDEIFFEAFSRDESSYARLGLRHEAFSDIDSFECGTTNVDFSGRLANELDKLRTYRRTAFEIAPGGIAVTTGEASHHEKKVELPDSWVQGFLQVHSTMAMALTHVPLAPVDLFNICRALARRRARTSPRALRWELEPGQRGRAVLEPWGDAIELSIPFPGDQPVSVRTWGRARLGVLARLLPIARSVDLYLAGFGLPSIYVLRADGLSFTLALSGWTDNDWTGGARFDLLTRRLDASGDELLAVYEELRRLRAADHVHLAATTGLSTEKVRAVLSHLCQIGRAMFDLATGVFRHRDLFFTPFTRREAMAAANPLASDTTPVAQAARTIFDSDNVRVIARRPVGEGWKISASALGTDGKRVRPLISVDGDGQILDATCTCGAFKSHRLTRGPCEHMLALRLAHMRRLEIEGDDRRGGGHHH